MSLMGTRNGRKQHTAEFKAKVALAELSQVFSNRSSSTARAQEDLTATLYQQIGQLKVELDWLKKMLPAGNDALRKLMEPGNEHISIKRQCELLGGTDISYIRPGAGQHLRGTAVA